MPLTSLTYSENNKTVNKGSENWAKPSECSNKFTEWQTRSASPSHDFNRDAGPPRHHYRTDGGHKETTQQSKYLDSGYLDLPSWSSTFKWPAWNGLSTSTFFLSMRANQSHVFISMTPPHQPHQPHQPHNPSFPYWRLFDSVKHAAPDADTRSDLYSFMGAPWLCNLIWVQCLRRLTDSRHRGCHGPQTDPWVQS